MGENYSLTGVPANDCSFGLSRTSSCSSVTRLLTCVEVHAERLEVDFFEDYVPSSAMKTTIAALALTPRACGGSNYVHTEIVSARARPAVRLWT